MKRILTGSLNLVWSISQWCFSPFYLVFTGLVEFLVSNPLFYPPTQENVCTLHLINSVETGFYSGGGCTELDAVDSQWDQQC